MNKCEEFERLISNRLDSALSSEDEKALDDHLTTCDSCGEFLAGVKRQRELLRTLPEIKATVQDAAYSQWWRRRLAIPVPIAAALALIAISGWLMMLGSKGGQVDVVAKSTPLIRSVEIIRVEAAQAVQVSDDKADGKKDEVL